MGGGGIEVRPARGFATRGQEGKLGEGGGGGKGEGWGCVWRAWDRRGRG